MVFAVGQGFWTIAVGAAIALRSSILQARRGRECGNDSVSDLSRWSVYLLLGFIQFVFLSDVSSQVLSNEIASPDSVAVLATPTPTPGGIQPIFTRIPTATPTSTPFLILPDLSVSDLEILDSLLIAQPAENAQLRASVRITLNAVMVVPTLDLQFSLLGSDGTIDETWVETVDGAELNESVTDLVVELSLADATPLEFDNYTLQVTADPKQHLMDSNRANNMAFSAVKPLLQTTGSLWFGAIETVLDDTSTFTVSPQELSGTASYAGQTVTFGSLGFIRDEATLDLIVSTGQASLPDLDRYEIDGWEYTIENGILDSSGVSADVGVYLPDSVSRRLGSDSGTTFRMDPIPLGLQNLGQNLELLAELIAIADTVRLYSEGIPLYIDGDSAGFVPGSEFTLVNPSVEYIHAQRFVGTPGERRTNDGLFKTPWTFLSDVQVTADGLQMALKGDAGTYNPAFPYGTQISHGEVSLQIVNGAIDSTVSTAASMEIELEYETTACEGASVTKQKDTFAFSQNVSISSDGAIAHEGDLTTPYTFAFNTYSGDLLDRAAWYQPGFLLRTDAPSSAVDQVDRYLSAGRSTDSESLYYYGEDSFVAGQGYYPGINFLPGDLDGLPVTVVIGGDSPLDITLNEGSKFYIRRGGYTGTLDGTLGDDTELELYPDDECGGDGYAITLTSFGQAYLDNDSEGLDTKIDGQIDLPFPANIDVPFEDMTLDPCGNFTDGKIPEDAQAETRTLQYWIADLTLSTVGFDVREGSSDSNDRTLWISSVHDVSGLGDKPLMQINFRPCGTIADSLVAEPVSTTFDEYGTTLETLYLTAWDGSEEPNGFYSFINSLEVPFFDPPRVHSQIRPTSHRIADGSAWDDGDVDTDRDGWPSGYSPSDTELTQQFIDYSNDKKITLETLMGGVIPLAYEVQYDPSDMDFRSSEAYEQDLLVINIESEIEHLDQEYAEITFGAGIHGIPELNFSSLADGAGDALQELFFDAIRDELDNLSDRLTGDLSTALRSLLRDAIDEHVQNAVDDIQSRIADLPIDEAEAVLDADLDSIIEDLLKMDIDLETALGPGGEIYSTIVLTIEDIIDVLEQVSEAMRFSVDDIEGMAGDLIDIALLALDFVTDFDIDQILDEVEAIQQEIVAPIDEILAVLYEVEAVVTDPSSLAGDYFNTTNITDALSGVQSDLKSLFNELPIEQIETLDADEITDLILDGIFNSTLFQDFNALVSESLIPVKELLYEQATVLLDKLNELVDSFLEEAGSSLEGAEGAFKNVSGFRGAEMEGYAIISGDVLEKLHIDASLTVAVPDEMTFAGYLDVTRFDVENSGKTCYDNLDAEAGLDIRVGATDIDLSWTGSDVKASIEFALMLADAELVNVGGSIIMEGTIDFEAVSFNDLGFGIAIGQVENYMWAMGGATFNTYTVEGGIFFGTSCSLEPLEIIDPEVASVLTIEEMRGVYASVGGSFPIYNYGCLFRIAAEAEVAAWYFDNGPTYGGKLVAGAYGEGLCVVSVKGEFTLIGGREGTAYFFAGSAWVAGGIGDCEPEEWDTLDDALSDSWCASCGASIDLTYVNEDWEVDYDARCK